MRTEALETASEVLFAQICFLMALEYYPVKVKNSVALCRLSRAFCELVFEAKRFSASPPCLPRIWEAETALAREDTTDESRLKDGPFCIPMCFRFSDWSIARISGIHCLSSVWTPLNLLNKEQDCGIYNPAS